MDRVPATSVLRGRRRGRRRGCTSDTPRRKPGACASKPASDELEHCTGLRYKRMHRHPRVAPQRVARRATVKQADGVRASAVAIGNRWLSLARGTLPAQAEMHPKGSCHMVFVVDVEKRPLDPCHPARARALLTAGKAAVWRHYPFTLILRRAVPQAQPHPLRVK